MRDLMSYVKYHRTLIALAGLTLSLTSPTFAQLPAFPGAEGFGSTTVGGRGGQVYTVTNLNPDGPGSLRQACQASGPRIVVFAVGGTILLNDGILIDDPYITIAGQTAPAGGITLRNSDLHDASPMVIITHDVVVRHIRFRPGPSVELTTSVDALGIEGAANNIVIDHCSLSWSVDETLQLWGSATVNGPYNVTIQWCLIAEALHCSSHVLGCHSKSVLLGTNGTHDVSMHHCLVAHNDERNPRFGSTHGVMDFVNNVIYNPITMGHVTNSGVTQPPSFNYVGNYVKHGPNSELIGPYGPRYELFCWDDGPGFSMYVDGNIGPHRPVDDDNLYLDELVVEPDDRQWMIPTPHPAPAITTQSPTQAYNLVLARAGANKPYRDTVDARVVTDTINGTGSIIDDPSEVGGWPALPPGTPRLDTDGDGMPDDWETAHGLLLNDPSDGSTDRDGDGYTNVEEWFNSLADCGSTDTDGDYAPDLCDNCPADANVNQLDTDADGIGDACDPDDDGDTIPDTNDNCPLQANTSQEDNDLDGFGNVCDTCTDADGDGWGRGDNGNTTCPAGTELDCDDAGTNENDPDIDNVCDPTDNCPAIANADQADQDGDNIGDVCDDDVDGDGVPNTTDNCPLQANADQADDDNDQVGNLCDACLNTAAGIPVNSDGCPALQVGPDMDTDGDVDLADFGLFQVCLSGEDVDQTAESCNNAKLDPDNDVDMTDMTIFLQCLTGPNVLPITGCDSTP